MQLTMQRAFFPLAIMFSVMTVASAQNADPVPSARDVVAKMMQLDAQRQSELTGYTAARRYVAGNEKRRAEMLVRVSCDGNGAKQFSILSEEGSTPIRKPVFHQLISEATAASPDAARKT